MSSNSDRHDYSLLGSFMPKDGPDPRASIPVEVSFGDDKPAPEAKPSVKPAEPGPGAAKA